MAVYITARQRRWKIHDAMCKIEKLGSTGREKVITDDMAARVMQLRTDCPSDWSPAIKELKRESVDMRGKHEDIMEAIGKASSYSSAG